MSMVAVVVEEKFCKHFSRVALRWSMLIYAVDWNISVVIASVGILIFACDAVEHTCPVTFLSFMLM